MNATKSAGRETVIQKANIGLERYLAHVTDMQELLEAVVADGDSVNIPEGEPEYQRNINKGFKVSLGALPNKTSITVMPRDETTLSGGRYWDGILRGDDMYSAQEPFAGGVLLRADFYTREKTDGRGPVGFNLMCIQKPFDSYPNDWSAAFYVADAVIVQDQLLPQVALAVVHDAGAIQYKW